MAVMTIKGLVPHTSRMPKASRSAMPVFWIASPRTTLAAKTMRIPQLMESIAWLGVQQRNRSMAPAAMKAHCNKGMTLSAERTTIVIMIAVDINVLEPMLGTCVESKNCNCDESCSVLIFKRGGHSKSSVSPACNTTWWGESLMRLPLRATATSVMLLSFSKEEWPSLVLISVLPKVT